MKKILAILLFVIASLLLIGCESEKKLYVLNVGDYIDDTLLEAFEEEYECKVVYTEVNSNEEIYQKLKNEDYDICVVSDYMIDRMYQENLIQKIDYSKLPNYNYEDLYESAQKVLESDCASYKDYFLPYFWGTVGILYNTDVEGLKEYVEENGLMAIFQNNEYNKGMYNSARDCLCMSLMAMGEDLNSPSEELLRKAMEQVRSTTYRAWGDDNLKALVHFGTLDMALVYSGDYLDEAYQCEIDMEIDETVEINFDFFAPDETNLWFDGMVITSQSKNTDLAYEFLNFFCDLENAAQNSDYIGYCPLNEKVVNYLYTSEEEGGYGYTEEDLPKDFFIPYGENRKVYKYVSNEHYNLLNDLLEEAKSK